MFTVIVDEKFVATKRSWLANADYRLAASPDEVWDYVAPVIKGGGRLGMDFETTGLNVWTDKIVGASFSRAKGSGIYAPVRHFEGAAHNLPLPALIEICAAIDAAPSVEQQWFHTDYDHEIAWHDWHWRPTFGKWRDVMIGVFLEYSDAPSHGLKDSADRLLNLEMIEYAEMLHAKKGAPIPGFQHVHPLQAPLYACADADVTLRLAELATVRKAIETQAFIWDLEHKILAPVREGVNAGVPLDGTYLRLLQRHVREALVQLEADIRRSLNVPDAFNLRARDPLAAKLKDAGVPLTQMTPGKKISTRKTTLAKFAKAHPVCAQLIQYAELGAADRNYITKSIGASAFFGPRVHIQFNTIGAPTGRMSSGGAGRTQAIAFTKGYANLNGQSWPDPEKQPYLPDVRAGVSTADLGEGDEWVIVAGDYSQVELRVLANVAPEPRWIEMFAKGIDIHAGNAALVEEALHGQRFDVAHVTKPMRKRGKITSFAVVYQAQPKTVAEQAGISEEDAAKIIEAFLSKCTGINRWVGQVKYSAEANGFVSTAFGRRRALRGYFSADKKYDTKEAKQLRARGQREAVNAPIQGGAADVFKIAIYKVWKFLREIGAEKEWVPIMWVHDELVSLVRRRRLYELLPQVQHVMQFPVKGWPVPLKVDMEVGWNWGTGKPPEEPSTMAGGRNWGYGLLSWETWLARYPPETADQPLISWLPATYYGVTPTEPAAPEDAVEDLLGDEEPTDDAENLDDLLGGV